MTSCEGRDHGNSRDSRDGTHYCAHHARRRGGRLQGIPCTTGKKVIDHFSLQVRVGEKEPIPLTPILGRLALVDGIANGLSGQSRAMRLKKDGTPTIALK
jgi:hypothetical protein